MSTHLAPIVGPQAANSVLIISKAKIKKGLLYCEFTEQTALDEPARQFSMQGTQPVHEDLTYAVRALVAHFVRLTEQLPTAHPDEDLESFEVTGFNLSNKDGVTLSGNRTLSGGGVLNLTAPFVSFDPDQWDDYNRREELEVALKTVLVEVELALRGKCSDAGRQLQLFEQQPEEAITELLNETTQPQQPTPAPIKKRKARRLTSTTVADAE